LEDTPRYRRDLAWNLGSILVLGLSGIFLNLAIGAVHGSAALGVFNQALTCYMIASQVAVAGLYFSTLHYSAMAYAGKSQSGSGLLSALLLGALQATLATMALYALTGPIAAVLQSPPTQVALLGVLPGLWCLTLNKILLAALNGYRCMRLFAALGAMRYLAMMGALGGLLLAGVEADHLTWCLSAAEILLLPLLVLAVSSQGLLQRDSWSDWLVRHLRFGAQSSLSGLLLDLNTRVDLMVLGYFCSDEVVGVFSCAALFAEGFYHILIAVKSNTTPLLSTWPEDQRQTRLRDASRALARKITPWLGLLWLVSVPIYSPLLALVTGSHQLADGWSIYAIMGLGFVAVSAWFPLFYALNQWGHAGAFTAHLGLVFFTNIALNLALVPLYQAHGAALATLSSWCLSVLLFGLILRRATGISIGLRDLR
jgi:O-antigen/teichoic acid export membrane protein